MENQSVDSRPARSPYSNRSVDPHGIEKYLATVERKHAENYNQILENRIQKLLKEEQVAKKLAEMAYSKDLAMTSNKDRKIKEIEAKEMLKNKKKIQEEEQRIKNFIERERRKKNMSDLQQSILRQRQSIVNEVKKTETLGDQALAEFKQLIEKRKVEKVQVMKYQLDLRKNNRSRSEFNYKSKLRQDYESKISMEKSLFEKTISKRKELEAIESQLLQKYSSTHVGSLSPQSFGSHVFNTSYSQNPESFK